MADELGLLRQSGLSERDIDVLTLLAGGGTPPPLAPRTAEDAVWEQWDAISKPNQQYPTDVGTRYDVFMQRLQAARAKDRAAAVRK
jgi:hypothetical protein